MDENQHACQHDREDRRDKLDAGQYVPPGEAIRRDQRVMGQFSWREAQPDQSDQREEQIADEPEQVGWAARTVGVGGVEQQQGGPGVGDDG